MNYGTFRSMTVLLGAAALWGTGCSDSGSAQIEDMRCEYMRSPVGIGLDMPPRFTWTYAGDEDFVQGKCRVRIASTKEALADSLAPGDVWTSPEIVSGNGFVECDAARAPHALLLERDGMGRGRTDRLLAGRQLRDGDGRRWLDGEMDHRPSR